MFTFYRAVYNIMVKLPLNMFNIITYRDFTQINKNRNNSRMWLLVNKMHF